MAERLPDSAARVTAAPLAWQRKGAWRIPTRALSAVTAVSFVATQLLAAAPTLAEPVLPQREDPTRGDSVPLERALAGRQSQQQELAQMTLIQNAVNAAVSAIPLTAPTLPANRAPIGYLDAVDVNNIVGWAVDPDAPTGARLVRVVANNRAVGTPMLANRARTDLVQAGVAPNPEHGYVIPVSGLGLTAGTYTITVQAQDPQTGQWTGLTGSKTVVIPANRAPIGFLDVANENTVAGWALDPDSASGARLVRVVANGRVTGAPVTANQTRPDLVQAGVAPNPEHGYAISTSSLGLTPGSYSLTVQAQDPQNGQWVALTGAKTVVIVDRAPPVVALQSALLVNRPSYTLTYRVIDNFDPARVVSETLSLREGENRITRSISDAAGNITPAVWTVTLDTLPPQVRLNSATLTNRAQYTLAYSVDGANRQEALTLVEGANRITRSISDAAGNITPAVWTITLDTIPPQVTLSSPATTSAELYTLLIQADGVNQPAQSWRLGRGAHRIIVQTSDSVGNAASARFIVTQTGTLPAMTEPPALPDGNRLTQTLPDGSVAVYVQGTLILVTTPDGTRLVRPAIDDAGRITGGWLTTPDGTSTFLEAGKAVWNRDSLGAVTWYLASGRPEAIRAADGTLTTFAYRLDSAGQVAAIVVTTGETSTLLDADGSPVTQWRADGSRLQYAQGRLSRVETPGRAEIRYTESTQADGSIASERPAGSATDLPRRIIYTPEGSLKEVTQADGTVIRFSGGIPTQAVSPDGAVTSFTTTQADSILSSLSVTRDGIRRTYDASGAIRQITLPDQAALELQGETAQGLTLADGTQIRDGVYDAASRLISGTVTLPDGRVVRYAGGQPVEATLPDGSRVTYSAGAPAGLTLPNGSAYTLTHETARWVAALIPPAEGAPASDPLTRMVYSEEWALQQATRADGAQMAYADGLLSTLTQANGTVISYAYDAAGRLANTVAAGPDTAEPVIRTEYAYDRIRKVFKGDTLIYEYSYEFDSDGDETTTLRDLQANRVKRYRDGLLISQTDPDGAVTTYEYTVNPSGWQDPMENALEARQMLPDGTFAYYHRTSPASLWELEGTNPEAELPTDRLSLFRLTRQGRLEAVGVSATAAGSGSPRIAAATVLYQGRLRAGYTYRYEGTLTRVTDQAGVTRVYDDSNRLVAIEQIEGPSYSVSAARDLSAEQETQLEGLNPSSPEALEILANPMGEEISVHRLTRVTLSDGMVITENFAPDTITAQEFDSQGRLLTRSQANGRITLYEDGRPTQTLDTKGSVTTRFTYDEAGQLVKLSLLGARRELADETAAARAEVIRKRADALEELALRKQLAIGQIADQTAQGRAQLQDQLTDLGQKLSNLENTDVHGRSAKKQKSRALDQIRAGMNQVRDVLSSLDSQYSQALGSLEAQVESVRNQLESQSASAFTSITAKEEEFTRQIIRQEILVILTRVYRNVIGRDPDEKETSEAVDQLYAQFGANPDAALDLTALNQKIQALPDYPVRVQQVAQIRLAVSAKLAAWETASDEQKAAQMAPYGVSLGRVVPLNSESIAEIRTWLNTNSLHFGHSAFLALQGLLAQAEGIEMDAVTLAVEAIWLDILTGVISPRTTGDLELSLFSMEHVAKKYGLSVTPARVTLDDLKAMLPREITLFQAVSPDGRTSYELKEDGTLEIVDLSSDQVTKTVPLFAGLTATEPSISMTRQTDGSLLLQTQGLPVGGIVSFWTENDQAGEAGVYYIKPFDVDRSYFTLPAEGVARIPPPLPYRPGHARVLVFKDAQAIATFQQRQREMHYWSGPYATNFFKDILVTRPGVSYKISDLDKMKADSSFMSSTGLMVFDLGSGGNLAPMSGFWNPPPDPVFTPQQMLITPDGNTLWVRASGKTRTGAALISLDLRTGAVSHLDTGLITPAQMALSLDGTILYVQDAASPEGGLSSLVAMDAAAGQVLKRASLPVGALAGMAVTAGNRILLAGKKGTQLFFLNAATLQTVRVTSGYSSIESLALRPDGQVAYLLDSSRKKLFVVSTSTGQTLSEIQTDGASGEVAFSPDGTVVYLTRHDTGTVLRLDAASHQPIQEVREGEGGATQAFRRRTAPILAHVNGNHYLHVLAVTADGRILVREPNKGPNGSIVALSAEEFSRIWQGVILSPRAPPHAYQRLTDSETLSITGSFFPVLIAIFAAVVTAVSTAVATIIAAVTALLTTLATVLSTVFSALGAAFSSIGSFFSGFGSLFSGAGLIGQGFSALFAGQLLGGLSLIGQGLLGAFGLSSFSWAALGQFALTTAVNVGVSRGLEALGVSPTVASLAGAFTSGGISGALNPVGATSSFLTKFAAGALTSTAVAGTQIGLVKAGLDPALASLAGIGVGTITSSLISGVNIYDPATGALKDHLTGLNALGYTLSTQLAPTLAGELAFYGIQRLGESIGLDPRLSQLAGMPIKAGIGNIANPATRGQGIINSMWEGLKSGVVSVGTQMATQALNLDPFAGSLVSRTLSGAISGAISPSHNVFQGVYDAFRQSVGNFSTIPPPPDPEDPRFIATLQNGTKVWDQAAYNQAIGQYEASRPVWMAQALAKTNNFSDEIRQYGLAQAVENYATSIFHRDSVESLVQSFGTIKDAITQRMQQNKIQNVTLEDGTQAKKLSLADDKDFALLYKEDPFGEISLLGLTEDEIDQRYYELRADRQTRTAGMTEGTITRTYRSTAPNGTTVTAQFLEEVSAAGVTKVTIQDSQGNSYTVTPNSFQDIRLNADGSIRNGLLTASSGAKFYFQNGILIKSRLVGRTDVETGEPLDPFRVSPTSSSDFVMEITEAISGQPRMITLEGNPPPEVAQILQNQPEFQRYLSDFLVPPAHAETVEPVVGIAEAFSDLNGYLKSQGFGTIRDTQGNTAAVDALYGRAAQLAGGDTRKTLEYFLAIVNIKDRKLDINDLEWERRVRNLPSGLVGTFKPLSESYDNRDKLQHFATSALLTYRTNRIFADFAGRAYEWHDWAQKFTTDYLDPTYTNNGGYSNEDVRANRLGQDFGTVVKQEGGTKPSYVLY